MVKQLNILGEPTAHDFIELHEPARLSSEQRRVQRAGYERVHVGKRHVGDDPTPRPGYDAGAANRIGSFMSGLIQPGFRRYALRRAMLALCDNPGRQFPIFHPVDIDRPFWDGHVNGSGVNLEGVREKFEKALESSLAGFVDEKGGQTKREDETPWFLCELRPEREISKMYPAGRLLLFILYNADCAASFKHSAVDAFEVGASRLTSRFLDISFAYAGAQHSLSVEPAVEQYRSVCHRFASELKEIVKPGDRIWNRASDICG